GVRPGGGDGRNGARAGGPDQRGVRDLRGAGPPRGAGLRQGAAVHRGLWLRAGGGRQRRHRTHQEHPGQVPRGGLRAGGDGLGGGLPVETMKKRPTLRQVLAGYRVTTGGLWLLGAAVWGGSFGALVRAGVIWPADRMSQLAYEAKTAVEAAGTLPPEALPERCGYLLLDGEGRVLSTNLTGRRLEAALERSPRGSLWSPYRLRLLEAPQTDSTVYLFQYDYAVHYADPALDGTLPDFQTCWLLAGAGAVALIVLGTTRRTGRLLTADAQLLSRAAAQVAARELEGEPFGGARV